MLISNSAQFVSAVNARLEVALNGIMQRLLIELQATMDEDIYSYVSEGSWHGRTNQFRESWDYDVPYYDSDMLMSVLSNNGFNFTWNNDRDTVSHGNFSSPLTVQAMNEVLNDKCGNGMNFPVNNTYYWDNYLRFLDTNFDAIAIQECHKAGLNLEYSPFSYKLG